MIFIILLFLFLKLNDTASPVNAENNEPNALSISALFISSIINHLLSALLLFLKHSRNTPLSKFNSPFFSGLYPPMVSKVDQSERAVTILKFSSTYWLAISLANFDFPVPGGPVNIICLPFFKLVVILFFNLFLIFIGKYKSLILNTISKSIDNSSF